MVGDFNAFRAQLVLPAQCELFDYWLSCSIDGAIPQRQRFTPVAVPHLLPNVSLIDVDRAGRFRVRLAGTQLRDVFDREITGLQVSDLERMSSAGYWQRACSSVVETGLPMQGAIKSPRITKDHLVQFWLRLPFAAGDGSIGQLLGFDACIPAADLQIDLSQCDQGEPDALAV
ncbi:MAG: PAS domain-containing protein [Pseudomonadota bacterium]